MTRNTFGNLFTLTTFGESHGEAVGGVIDGMPAGIDIDWYRHRPRFHPAGTEPQAPWPEQYHHFKTGSR